MSVVGKKRHVTQGKPTLITKGLIFARGKGERFPFYGDINGARSCAIRKKGEIVTAGRVTILEIVVELSAEANNGRGEDAGQFAILVLLALRFPSGCDCDVITG